MSSPKTLIGFFLGVLLAWIASAPSASDERDFAWTCGFIGLQLAPRQYLVRNALALSARSSRKPDR